MLHRRALHFTASGHMAHSAYPELGESAIDKLIPALARLRAMPLPSDPEVGPCTLNIGLIEGGRAPNVIPDYAHADLLYRLIGPSQGIAAADSCNCGRFGEGGIPAGASLPALSHG